MFNDITHGGRICHREGSAGDTLSKLNRISKFVGWISLFLIVLMAIAIVAIVAVTLAGALNPDLINDIADTSFTGGQVLGTGVVSITGCALGLAVFYFIYSLFMNIHRKNTPFADENVKYLEKIAIVEVLGAIVLPILGFASEYGQNAWLFNFGSMIPVALFVAFVAYFMSLILKYGTALQKESDETL